MNKPFRTLLCILILHLLFSPNSRADDVEPVEGGGDAGGAPSVITPGMVRQSLFLETGDGVAISNLVDHPNYPANPSETSFLTSLEIQGNQGNEYGVEVSGFIIPDQTGPHHFWISSDDAGEFWLSTDDDPGNLTLLAHEPVWNGPRQFAATSRRNATDPENQSKTLFPAGIGLVAGQPYYFQARMKESGGGDNLAVAWQVPGGPEPTNGSTPIGSINLGVAADPIVENNNDSGPGSLRQAIADAAPGATITFNSSLVGQTIILTNGQLLIDKALTIDAESLSNGQQPGITIDGNGLVPGERVMEITSGVTVTLGGLTVRGGVGSSVGGGIYNRGTLTVDHSTISDNTAGVGGGGISNEGTLTVNHSTISDNTAGLGGGIFNGGTLTVHHSTISDNTARGSGGGIFSATDLALVKMTAINCTFTGNSATFFGGAVYNHEGRSELIHCTLVGNSAPAGEGSGVASDGDNVTETIVQACIISGNTNSDVDLVGDTVNSFTSSGYNLIGTGNALDAFNKTGDQTNSVPLLAPLADYGGFTQTMPLLVGSPGVNQGGPSPLIDDQHGLLRGATGWANDFSVDLGGATAFGSGVLDGGSFRLTPEANSVSGALVLPDPGPFTTFSASFDFRFSEGAGFAFSPADGISFSFGPNPNGPVGEGGYPGGHAVSFYNYNGNHATDGAIYYRHDQSVVTSSTTFHRFDDANKWHRVGVSLTADGRLTATFNGVTILENIVTGYVWALGDTFTFGARTGGSVSEQRVDNVSIVTDPYGGAPDIGAVEALINNPSPAHNGVTFDPQPTLSWTGPAGASYEVFFGDVSGNLVSLGESSTNTSIGVPTQLAIGSTHFWRVDATVDGITYTGSEFSFTSTAVLNNNDSGPGSLRQAIADAAPGETISFDSILVGQTIILTNGQLLIDKALTIDAESLSNGQQPGITIDGNGLVTGKRVMEITSGVTVTLGGLIVRGGDGIGVDGGGIYNRGTLTVNHSTILDNTARFGGGIANQGTLTVHHSTISDNTAGVGGGIINWGTLTVHHSTISDNTADDGGGIYSDTDPASEMTAINCTFTGNSATGPGGAIYNRNGRSELIHCTLVGNSAPAGSGSGVASYGDNATETIVQACIISGNANSDADLVVRTFNNSFTSSGYNLIGTGNALGAFNKTGDQINSVPLLAPLANYGGATETMPLLAGSPGVNQGGPSPVIDDQHGLLRGATGWANDFSVDLGGATAFGSGVLDGESFRLTPEANSVSGALVLPDPGPFTTFSASFDFRYSDPAGSGFDGPADGISFSFGPNPNGPVGEGGYPGGHAVSFYNYNNNHATDGAIYYRHDQSVVTSSTTFHRFNDANKWHRVGVTLTSDGRLTATFNGVTILENIPTGYVWVAGDTFTFGAGTGGFVSEQRVDNVSIVTDPYGGAPDIGAVETLINNPSPAHNSVTFNPQPTLSWTGPAGASYEVFFGDVSGHLVSLGASSTNTSISVPTQLAIGSTHFWRVDATVDGITYTGSELSFTRTTVYNNNDSGRGSLRQAIADAAPGATISFDSSLFGQTIILTNGQLLIDKALTIDAESLSNGQQPGITIDGNGMVTGERVMEITSGVTVTLGGLIVRGGGGGGAGGGIRNRGTLTVNHSTISDNTADGDGGGIYNLGTLTVHHSTISDNTADIGGGIYNLGTLTVNHSTISDNTADIGGGISSNTDLALVKMTAINCTFTGNSATTRGGAVYNIDGRSELIHCTLVGNSAPAGEGSGVASFGDNATETIVQACIISGNTNSDVDLVGQTFNNSFTSSGYNLIGTGDALADFTQPGDQTNTAPLLAPLGDYGGPTKTMALLPGSPAIDAADHVAGLDTDQRGFIRNRDGDGVAGAQPDIGAYEGQVQPISIGFQFRDGNVNGGDLLAPSEIAGAPGFTQGHWNGLTGNNSGLPPNTVSRSNAAGEPLPGLSLWWRGPNTWRLAGPANTPDKKLMFGYLDSNAAGDGSTEGDLFNNAAAQPYLAVANLSSDVTLGGYKVVVYVDGDRDVGRIGEYWLSSNRGADPSNVSAESVLTPSFFTSDTTNFVDTYTRVTATSDVGVATAPGNYMVFEGLSEGGFTVRAEEGSIPAGGGKRAPINAVQVVRNEIVVVTTAADELDPVGVLGSGLSLREALRGAPAGAGILFDPTLDGQTITLTRGELIIETDLTIDASGLSNGIVLSGDSDSSGDSSDGDTRILGIGRAIPNHNVLLKGLTLSGGVTKSVGGAILTLGNLTVRDSTFRENQANGGGAIASAKGGRADVERSTFVNNAADQGGAIYHRSPATLSVRNSTFTGNHGRSRGGALYSFESHMEVMSSTISGNTAVNDGGGIYNENGTLTLTNTVVAANMATASPNIFGDFVESGSFTNGNPLLAPLGDYGGLTETMPPLPGSPAIDAAGLTALATDQRGAPRVNGPSADIGAVEAFPFSSIPLVDTDGDGIDDRLEEGFFGDLTTANATSDTDGDGSSDKDELGAMTDPTDAASFFYISGFEPTGLLGVSGPLYDVTFTTFPGLSYSVDLDQDVNFTAPGTTSVGVVSDYSFTIRVELSAGQEFIRVRRD